MKKIFLSILTIIYMTVSSGIAMEIHYCMGKRAGVELFHAKHDKCSKCGMTEKRGCCHDEQQFHKLADSHENVYNTIAFDAGDVAILTGHNQYSRILTPRDVHATILINAPPDDTQPSKCIMNCVFRI